MFENTLSCFHPITVCILRFALRTLAFISACRQLLYLSITQYLSAKAFDHDILSACSEITSPLAICILLDISIARHELITRQYWYL
jgi:hypothetical protein